MVPLVNLPSLLCVFALKSLADSRTTVPGRRSSSGACDGLGAGMEVKDSTQRRKEAKARAQRVGGSRGALGELAFSSLRLCVEKPCRQPHGASRPAVFLGVCDGFRAGMEGKDSTQRRQEAKARAQRVGWLAWCPWELAFSSLRLCVEKPCWQPRSGFRAAVFVGGAIVGANRGWDVRPIHAASQHGLA